MLDFLVLGQLPGTHIQYNFNDVLLAFAWTLVILEAVIFIHRYRTSAKLATAKTAEKGPLKSSSTTSKRTKKQQKATIKMVPKSATP